MLVDISNGQEICVPWNSDNDIVTNAGDGSLQDSIQAVPWAAPAAAGHGLRVCAHEQQRSSRAGPAQRVRSLPAGGAPALFMGATSSSARTVRPINATIQKHPKEHTEASVAGCA